MPEFTERIRRVTAELQQILAELDRAASSDGNVPQSVSAHRERVQRELLVPGAIHDFKTAVDEMRLVLWSYMSAQAHSKSPDASLQSVETHLQSVRMQRVTEMLKSLKPDVESGSAGQLPEHATFLELIHDIAHTAMDKHAQG